ncbi:unnamed protein product [Nippostrongylus brasiliensis]|uniref:DDE_Tnp_1_7 domain-containing protein n=1 Tax=Nippostrongylus brasiliensis TaxID=27835 RepID=A0A0N4XYH1_NIPBR|nr:unnamed protein product [Nippostrongylus brasiliensis]
MQGRCLCTGNWYTSLQLAHTLLKKKTDLWYVRLFFHLVTQTSLVNAWILYCEKVKKIGINYFKELIVDELLYQDLNNSSTTNQRSGDSTNCKGERQKALLTIRLLQVDLQNFRKVDGKGTGY